MRKVIVLTNPRSGTNLKDKQRIKRIRWLIDQGETQGEVHATQNLAELEEVARKVPAMRPDILAIDGGDGTIATVIGAIHRRWPKDRSFPSLALLAGGTFNALAKYAGITKGIAYLQDIIEVAPEELFFQEIDLMEIEDDRGKKMYGFSFGIGLPVYLLQEYYKKKRLKYLRILFMLSRLSCSTLIKGKYYNKFNQHVEAELDGSHDQWLTIFAQSIPSFGTYKCNVFYRAGLARRNFHVLGGNMELKDIIKHVVPIYLGKKVDVCSVDTQREMIHLKSSQEFSYQVNGELDYWGEKCVANEVRVRHGITVKVIKPIPQAHSKETG